LLAGGAVWKHRCCVVREANGLAVNDLKHVDDTLGGTVPKAERTLRVAMEMKECIEVKVLHKCIVFEM
jgi:hypothetical protein